jgi:hypothetical protein
VQESSSHDPEKARPAAGRHQIRLLPAEKAFAAGLKAGESLTVVGRFAYAVAGEVKLDSCLPLTK